MAQETFLFNETIRFNLLLAQPKANEKDIIDALKLASANEFVMKLPEGLDTLLVIGELNCLVEKGSDWHWHVLY